MTIQHIEARLAAALAVAAIVFLASAPAARAGTGEVTALGAGVSQTAAQPVLTTAEEKWGVQIVGIRMSAGGYMLDFRYRVLDPEKAAPILDRRNRPYLIDQASGTVVGIKSVPKLGRLRQNTMRPEVGRVYFMLFTNSGILKANSKVTVVVGDFRAEDITVEG